MTNTLDELERLHAASTPGEWRVGSVEKYHVFCPHDAGLAGPGGERVLLRMNEHFAHDAEAALIVALHNAFPALLEYVRALEAVAKRAADYRDEQSRGFGEGDNHVQRLAMLSVVLDNALSRLDAARAKLNGGK